MYQFFVEPERIDVAAKSVIIRGTDVNHIKNVLRMRPGEEVAVSNGIDGKEYRCGILALEEDCVRLELRFIKEDGVELPAKIYLFQGLPKADKMELIIQKAVELGAFQVIPVSMLGAPCIPLMGRGRTAHQLRCPRQHHHPHDPEYDGRPDGRRPTHPHTHPIRQEGIPGCRGDRQRDRFPGFPHGQRDQRRDSVCGRRNRCPAALGTFLT